MAQIRSISRLIVCVLISIALLAGGASAQSEEDRRKIVLFADGTPPLVQKTIVLIQAPGSEIVHTLSLITALAIRLPLLPLDELEALVQSLLNDPLGPWWGSTTISWSWQPKTPLLRWETSMRIPQGRAPTGGSFASAPPLYVRVSPDRMDQG